ncbi:MAG: hypothetical protein L6437_13880 [Kiritimatiellae bacterium]|nr:hypothetical protein [Kiritimatiellia bacterium]
MQFPQNPSGPVYGYQSAYRKKLFEYRPSYITSLYHHARAKSETSAVIDGENRSVRAIFAPLLESMVGYIDFSRPYLNKDLDPITGMFKEKAHFGRAVIEDVITDMALRYKMMNRAILTLDYQICAVDSEIMELPNFQIGFSKDLDKLKTALEKTVMDMDQQKHEERIAGWKDITRLKTDLLEVLKDYVATQASASFLNNTGGGKHY